ncbi:MAG: DUF2125 domain-containing protein, partial [Caulobacterales bacterium]
DPHALQISLNATGVVLRAPPQGIELLGMRIETLAAAIVAEDALPGGDIGPMRVEALRVSWGPLTATGRGALRRDDNGKLDGEITLTAERPLPSLDANGAADTSGIVDIPLRIDDDKIYKSDLRE